MLSVQLWGKQEGVTIEAEVVVAEVAVVAHISSSSNDSWLYSQSSSNMDFTCAKMLYPGTILKKKINAGKDI